MLRLLISATLFGSLFATSACAELSPAQIVILARAGDEGSENVAKYYARVRQIPASQILAVPFPEGEELNRADWETKYRPAIRKWLRDKKLINKIKCFVTVWGVPLKIGKAEADTEQRRYDFFLKGELRNRIQRINDINADLHAVAPEAGSTPPAELTEASTAEEIRDAFQETVVKAQERAANIKDEDAAATTRVRIQNYYIAMTGLTGVARGLAQNLESSLNPDPNARAQIALTNGRLLGVQESRMIIDATPVSLERDLRMGALVEKAEGIFGALGWIREQIEASNRKETWASFDSELSMIAIADYELLRWQPNYLNFQYRYSGIRPVRPTFMVARIDAPTLAIARRIMDDSIKVEATGLVGKAYFDSRGIWKPNEQAQPGSYKDFDRSVVNCAELLQKHSTLEVVVNDKNELFQAGECPEAAIYCGWYSLGNYIDAFDWVQGAVGYHIASSEATTLKNPESKVWCKSMLEDIGGEADGGLCATLGPTYEPYLQAFPRPEQFYLMLLSGKYTLAECYYATKPFNSWTMTLIGDPLYNPFKVKSGLKEDLPADITNFLEQVGI
ncbi:MAG: TIGR03790 family protein [Planctomycetales bacterium]|nr:TIGR03790 family protein [Planctomycetales bacterium]